MLIPAVGIGAWIVAPRLVQRPPDAGAPPHPAAGMTAEQASSAGLRLAQSGRHLEAIPYLARAAALSPRTWFVHQNVAGALGNGALQARRHLGLDQIATRSSVERVAMLRASQRATTVAESLAGRAADRGLVVFERARLLQTWGLPIDALAEFRRALAESPTSPGYSEAVTRLENELDSGGAAE